MNCWWWFKYRGVDGFIVFFKLPHKLGFQYHLNHHHHHHPWDSPRFFFTNCFGKLRKIYERFFAPTLQVFALAKVWNYYRQVPRMI